MLHALIVEPCPDIAKVLARACDSSVTTVVSAAHRREAEQAARLRGASLCMPRSEDYRELFQVLWHVERGEAMRKTWERGTK